MKLIIAIVRDTDDSAVMEHLTTWGLRVTRVASTGGFLRRGNVTLLIGADAEQVPAVLQVLREACAATEMDRVQESSGRQRLGGLLASRGGASLGRY